MFYDLVGVFFVNGISTFMSYFMPKPALYLMLSWRYKNVLTFRMAINLKVNVIA